ncbi:MAG: GMC family oxidoreductase, partial [Caulobacteraceae bacterium]
ALLSAVWMALAFEPLGRRLLPEAVRRSHVGEGKGRLTRHLANLGAGLPGAAVQLARIAQTRYLTSPPRPGFLLPSREGSYALHYHAEQSPNPSSRVSLGGGRDRLGRPALKIDFRYSESDVRSVVRSHAVLDGALRAAGGGRLRFKAEGEALDALVWAQAAVGAHQTGTTRMGENRQTSVVDRDLRAHDLANLFVASSSVFPSPGQANPTFPAVALALRLADGLVRTKAAAREAVDG